MTLSDVLRVWFKEQNINTIINDSTNGYDYFYIKNQAFIVKNNRLEMWSENSERWRMLPLYPEDPQFFNKLIKFLKV